MQDPRVGWVVSLAMMVAGFVLAGPAEGWLQVVADLLLFGGRFASGVFFVLNVRAIPREQQRGAWWWSDWNER
jgi:hypothetical protein